MRSPKFLLRVPRHRQRLLLVDKIEQIHKQRGFKLKHNLNGMSIKQLEQYLEIIKRQNIRVVK